MSTHNLCFGQNYEKYQSFLSENFQFFYPVFQTFASPYKKHLGAPTVFSVLILDSPAFANSIDADQLASEHNRDQVI